MRLSLTILFLLGFLTTGTAQVSAGFTVDFSSGCAPHVVHFTNTSTGATSYSWDLGNGVITPTTNPSTSYLTAGTFTVTLTASSGSTSDTHTMVITVHPLPTVDFRASDTTICPGASVTFTNLSTPGVPGGMTYAWNFGDGSGSTAANPTHAFSTTGMYNITLVVTNTAGCQRIFTKPAYIEVLSPPYPSFFASPASVCNPPGAITFVNTTTGIAPLSYLWDLGAGMISSAPSPTATYSVPGLYDVRLTVTDGQGCVATLLRPAYVFVGDITAAFSGPATVCLDEAVVFTNTSSAHLSRTWSFGDGVTDTSFTGNHSYSSPGTYTVTLSINNGHCVDVVTHTITVAPPPVAVVTRTPLEPCPAPVSLSYSATAPSGSTLLWLFEGGAFGTGTTASHGYATNGVKETKLVVTDALGCVDTVIHRDTIYDFVVKGYAYPDHGCVPLFVNFSVDAVTYQPDSSSHTYPYPITSYTWDFGDGSPVLSGGSLTNHTYTATGIYIASITLVTANGCVNTDTMMVRVGSPPTVTFTASPTHVCYGDSVYFTATVLTGTVTNFEWSFGDGSGTSSSTGITHIYSYPGTFSVTLTPVHNGCPGPPYVMPGVIIVDSPMAVIKDSLMCSPATRVAFTNMSLGADTHIWFFGDGTSSTLDDPIHDYPAISVYTVTLTTHNIASGCRDTARLVVNLVQPTTDFIADDTAVCEGDDVYFTSSVTGGSISTYLWRVNGLTEPWQISSTLRDTFDVRGLYTIQLIVKYPTGCFDTITKEDYIMVGKPTAGFVATPIPGCWPLTVTFTDTSSDVTGSTFTAFGWDFGDGATALVTTPTVTHTYTLPGTYDVVELVTDNIGCIDTLESPSLVTVYKPEATFVASNTHPCINIPTNFTNTSTGIVSSFWIFGDGTTSTATSPAHAYSATGTYTVKLVVTDAHGCTDTAESIGLINVTKPTAAFSMSDTFSICPPLLVNFTNTSTGATVYHWDFGDGNISSLVTPTNMFDTPAYYAIRLVAEDAWGCTDTATNHLNLYGYAGSLTYTPLTGCVPLLVHFHAAISNVPSIIWDFGDGSTSVMSAVDSTSHYYTLPGAYVPKLILSDHTGCQNSSIGPDTIKVDEITAEFTVEPAACIGVPFTFKDTSTYYWSPVDTWLWTLNGDTTSLTSPPYQLDTPGSITVTLTVSNGWGCTATGTGTVVVHPPPEVYTSPDTVVCVSDPATLTGFGATSYVWGPATEVSCVECNPTTASPPVVSTYSVIGTDDNGCKDTAEVTVGLRTHTYANAWQDTSMCFGASVPLFDTGGHKYLWLPAGGLDDNTISNPTASPGSSITYTVIAQLGSCIPDTDYVRIEVFSLPTVDAGIDQEVLAGTPIELRATGYNIAAYEWSPRTGMSCYNCANPQVAVAKTTQFTVTVTSPQGCQASDSVSVYLFCNSKQVFVPTVFTPNGDGENDVFYPRGTGISIIKSFRIYNRWGEMMFERTNIELNDASNAWNGSYMGDIPRPDVYVYVIYATCSTGQPVMIKGDVTIIR